MNWYIGVLASAGFGLLVAFVIKGHVFMNGVNTWLGEIKGNHLTHIQAACEKTADGVQEVKSAILVHDTNERAHHEEMMRIVDRHRG